MTVNSIQGKNVLIGGGAKNLGGLVARDLAAQGARAVTVHYNSDATRADAEKTLADITGAGVEGYLVQADLTTADAVRTLFARAGEAMGSIDIAINTTGMVTKKPIPEITEADFDRIFAINAKAAFFFIQQAGESLTERGKLVTLVTSLLSAYTGLYSIYAGSKAPVEHFTRAAAKEFGSRGISVNAIAPGPDGDAVLLRAGDRRVRRVQPARRRSVGVHQDRAHRPPSTSCRWCASSSAKAGGSPVRLSSPTAATPPAEPLQPLDCRGGGRGTNRDTRSTTS